MLDYFYAGGPMFMAPLTILALAVVIVAVRQALTLQQDETATAAQESGINLVLHLGLFSFFLGVLAQALGLMQAFQIIEAAGGVSPALLMGGLRVSMIAPVYGLLILLGSFALWAILQYQWKARL